MGGMDRYKTKQKKLEIRTARYKQYQQQKYDT